MTKLGNELYTVESHKDLICNAKMCLAAILDEVESLDEIKEKLNYFTPENLDNMLDELDSVWDSILKVTEYLDTL